MKNPKYRLSSFLSKGSKGMLHNAQLGLPSESSNNFAAKRQLSLMLISLRKG
jgi:hypothetical protein